MTLRGWDPKDPLPWFLLDFALGAGLQRKLGATLGLTWAFLGTGLVWRGGYLGEIWVVIMGQMCMLAKEPFSRFLWGVVDRGINILRSGAV